MSDMVNNIILLVLDSVRKDTFDKFSIRLKNKADIDYSECRAVSGWSTPSHASMLTGDLPHQHRVHINSESVKKLTIKDTFLHNLPRYNRIGVSANSYISSSFDWNKLFDFFVDVNPYYRRSSGVTPDDISSGWQSVVKKMVKHPIDSGINLGYRATAPLSTALPIPKVGNADADLILTEVKEQLNEEPFFIFMNFMDAHWPLTPAKGFDHSIHNVNYRWHSRDHLPEGGKIEVESCEKELEAYRSLYNCSIEYLDRVVANFVDKLSGMCDNETTVIVTSDHGEHLGEGHKSQLFGHKGSISEALLHVPLIIINPPENTQPSVISNYVSQLDFPELILGISAGEIRDITKDRIAAERIGSNLPTEDAMGDKKSDWWNRHSRAVYRDGLKYQWDSIGYERVFTVADTPASSQAPVSGVDEWNIDKNEQFNTLISEYQTSDSADDAEIDEITKKRLKKLGYW